MTNLFLSVFEISVSTGLIVAALILFTPFLNKRYAAKWKYLIWIFLALRLLLPFGEANGQSIFNMLQTKTQAALQSEEQYLDTSADRTAPTRRVIVAIPKQMTTPIAMQSEKSNIHITLLAIVAFVWMIGSLIVLSVHLISYFYYKKQVMKKGIKIRDSHILHQMAELKGELHIRGKIDAVEYSEADSPMIIGFLKPVLVLPEEQYGSEELYFILKHELVHWKRGDVYFKLLFVTANAVHWFNPLIWIMQKEAAIDMELSCDERVTQGTNYDVRKAYTETLLSMLHKQCAKKTALSTQFYGGKKIMKKRFKNILIKKEKKNGISVLISAVILTISLGTLVGCSVVKEEAEDRSESENMQLEQMADEKEKEMGILVEGKFNYLLSPDDTISGNTKENDYTPEDTTINPLTPEDITMNPHTSEDTTMLTFFKEGEMEQKQATLMIGDGYSIYLPDKEWQQSDSDRWRTAVNEQVQLLVTHFENKSIHQVEEEFTNNGYVTEENGTMWKQEEGLIYHVILKEFESTVWGVCYCYPIEAEEGWGRELPVIADSFAVSTATKDGF